MREPADGRSGLDRHCSLGLMVAAGLATIGGFAAMGPLTTRGANALPPGGLAGLAIAAAHLAVACTCAVAFGRSQRAHGAGAPPRPFVTCLLCLLMFAWATSGALKSAEAFDGLWMALQGLATAACVLMMTERLTLELGWRGTRRIEFAMAAIVGAIGPVAWWAAGSIGIAGDLRWSAGPQAVSLVMTLVGALPKVGGSRPAQEEIAAASCLGGGLVAQWASAFGGLDLGTSDVALVFACCATVSLTVLARRPYRWDQPALFVRAPVVSASISDLSASRQRMAS